MTNVQVNYVIAKYDKLKRLTIEKKHSLMNMRKEIVIVWSQIMDYLDPDEAPWTPEYKERMDYLNRNRRLSNEELCIELLDEEHERAMLHHA
jgi:hypothetical protein